MEATIDTKCPYCGTTQRALLHVREWPDSASRPECVLCDVEVGGCDKWYVVSVVTRYEITTATISSEVEHKVWIQQPEPEAPAIVAPDWTKAPKWAQWWAVDGDGAAFWYEDKPEARDDFWNNTGACNCQKCGVVDLDGGHWYRSLVQRPEGGAL